MSEAPTNAIVATSFFISHLYWVMPNEQLYKGKDVVGQATRILDDIRETGATFLITDLDVAMTLAHIAQDAAEDSEKRSRNTANARHAYDDVSRISSRALLTGGERRDVDEKLAELRSALEQLGDVFD